MSFAPNLMQFAALESACEGRQNEGQIVFVAIMMNLQ